MLIKRTETQIKPDTRRVMLEFQNKDKKETQRIIDAVLALPEGKVVRALVDVEREFGKRHKHFKNMLRFFYELIEEQVPKSFIITDDRLLLLGAYFAKEITLEQTSLTSPSIYVHPDQTDLKKGSLRFLLSYITTSCHQKYLCFRSGIIDNMNNIKLYPLSDKTSSFYGNLDTVHYPLVMKEHYNELKDFEFKDEDLSELVIPVFTNLNICRLIKADASIVYMGIDYHNGKTISMETTDFKHFKKCNLKGHAINGDDVVIFPRLINGKYHALLRKPDHGLYICSSNDLIHWEDPVIVKTPIRDWEIFSMGLCGTPLELEKGWVVFTYGAGPLGKQVIGAFLLDKNNPHIMIKDSEEPIITGREDERIGSTPNMLICGGVIIYNDEIIFPYTPSGASILFGLINKDRLFE